MNNLDIVKNFYETAYVKHDMPAAERMLESGYVLHDPSRPGDVQGAQDWRKSQDLYTNAMPDHMLKIVRQFAQGDCVVTQWITTGTQKGDLPGIKATNKKVSIDGISITRVVNGKIAEEWMNWDTLGFLDQLGAVQRPALQKSA